MPSTTAFRPATEAQLRYINSLVAERDADAFGPLLTQSIQDIRMLRAGSRSASRVIDDLLAIPRLRAGQRTATPSRPSHDDIELFTPAFNQRAGRMLQAGGIEATVTLQNGEHMTIRVNTRQPHGRGWRNCAPTDEGARTNVTILGRKVGWINVSANGADWKLTLRTRNPRVKDAIRALFDYAANGGPTILPVREASRCGRCMRTLTDPVSIDRGIGPECYGRVTGSHHAAVEGNVSREHVARAAAYSASDAEQVEARMHRVAAEGEAAQERAAYEREMAEERARFGVLADPVDPADPTALSTVQSARLTEIAANFTAATPQRSAEAQRARDLIAEALDAYSSPADARFALQVFDRLTQA